MRQIIYFKEHYSEQLTLRNYNGTALKSCASFGWFSSIGRGANRIPITKCTILLGSCKITDNLLSVVVSHILRPNYVRTNHNYMFKSIEGRPTLRFISGCRSECETRRFQAKATQSLLQPLRYLHSMYIHTLCWKSTAPNSFGSKSLWR